MILSKRVYLHNAQKWLMNASLCTCVVICFVILTSEEIFISRFSSSSEAKVSELLENLERRVFNKEVNCHNNHPSLKELKSIETNIIVGSVEFMAFIEHACSTQKVILQEFLRKSLEKGFHVFAVITITRIQRATRALFNVVADLNHVHLVLKEIYIKVTIQKKLAML